MSHSCPAEIAQPVDIRDRAAGNPTMMRVQEPEYMLERALLGRW